MAWSLRAVTRRKEQNFLPQSVGKKISALDTHSEVFLGFLLAKKYTQKYQLSLGKASKPLFPVLDMVRDSKACLERAELCSLSNTKVSENPSGAISGT